MYTNTLKPFFALFSTADLLPQLVLPICLESLRRCPLRFFAPQVGEE